MAKLINLRADDMKDARALYGVGPEAIDLENEMTRLRTLRPLLTSDYSVALLDFRLECARHALQATD